MKSFVLAVTLAAALPAAASTALFSSYEGVRQGLLSSSLEEVQQNAARLATQASKAKDAALAQQAEAVAKSRDLASARTAFAALSDEMIRLRNAAEGDRPAVYHCSMVKKSWLQEKGKVGNPYAPSMQMCGELKAE